MASYVFGIVMGALTTVFPLIYLMNFDRCIALILSQQPEFDIGVFTPSVGIIFAVSITAIGAAVLLVSTMMAAITGFKLLKCSSGAGPAGAASTGRDSEAPVDTEEETEF